MPNKKPIHKKAFVAPLEADLRRMYVDEKLSAYAIAKKLTISHQTVQNYLIKFGIHTKELAQAKMDDKAYSHQGGPLVKLNDEVSLEADDDDVSALKEIISRINEAKTPKEHLPKDDPNDPNYSGPKHVTRVGHKAVTIPEGLKNGSIVPLLVPRIVPMSVDDIMIPPDLVNSPLRQYYVEPDQLKLTTTQIEAVNMLADLMEPKAPSEVATLLGLDRGTINKWMNRPLFQAALVERTEANFYSIGKFKLLAVYNKELASGKPGSRIMEQVAKVLGYFSDGAQIAVQVNLTTPGNQTDIKTEI